MIKPPKFQFSTSLLYNVAVYLSIVGVITSLIEFSVPQEQLRLFVWLIFYAPILWSFWIACVFFARMENAALKLTYLWGAINCTVLFIFIAFAKAVNNWAHSSGIEFAIIVPYFPVAMPTMMLITLLPEASQASIFNILDALTKLLGGGIGDAFAIWIPLSVVAAFQSLCIFGVSRIFRKYLLSRK